MDFQGVKFATRSFIDEFYNLFLKTPEANTFRVELNNVPSDIKAMLNRSHSVWRTIAATIKADRYQLRSHTKNKWQNETGSVVPLIFL